MLLPQMTKSPIPLHVLSVMTTPESVPSITRLSAFHTAQSKYCPGSIWILSPFLATAAAAEGAL